MVSKKIISLSFLLVFVNSYLFTMENSNELQLSTEQNKALSFFIKHNKEYESYIKENKNPELKISGYSISLRSNDYINIRTNVVYKRGTANGIINTCINHNINYDINRSNDYITICNLSNSISTKIIDDYHTLSICFFYGKKERTSTVYDHTKLNENSIETYKQEFINFNILKNLLKSKGNFSTKFVTFSK